MKISDFERRWVKMNKEIDALWIVIDLEKIKPEDELILDEQVEIACQQDATYWPPSRDGQIVNIKIRGPAKVMKELEKNISQLSGITVEPFIELPSGQ